MMLFAISLNAQQSTEFPSDSLSLDTSKTDLIKIDHADRTWIIQEDDRVIKKISGNIQLRQDTTYMYADSAVIFDSDEVYAFDSITIQQGDSLSIFSDTLDYLAVSKIATLTGEVVLAHAAQQLWTTRLVYDMNTKIAEYDRGATLYDDSLRLKSIRGYYNTSVERAKFIDSVVVVHPDFTLAADSLLYDIQMKRAIFIGPTRIIQEDRDIYCENGFYDVDDKVSTFSKNAQYKDDDKQAIADTIHYDQNTSIIEMIGSVDFIEDDRQILAEYLRYNEKTGETYMRGDAYFEDSLRRMKADEIFYNTKTDELVTKGKSKIEEDGQALLAENVNFDNEKNLGIASGDVIWADSNNQIVILADSLRYRKDIDYVTAFGPTRPMLKTVMEGDTLYLTAEELILTTEFDTLEDGSIDTVRQFDAFLDVKIYKDNLQGICDSMSMNTRDSIFRFYKNPILWSDTTQFSADSIEMYMEQQQLSEILLRRRGFIVNETGGIFFNQIKGKLINAYFDSQEVRRILVTGNAESIFYAMDEEDAFIGVNKSICSKMEFLLSDKQMRTIRFLKDPQQKMYPVQTADHNALRLEGFNWEVKERPKSIEDLKVGSNRIITMSEPLEGGKVSGEQVEQRKPSAGRDSEKKKEGKNKNED